MERERKIKRAKERGKKGETEDSSSSPVSPRFFLALSLALFFARAPLSERLEQANIYNITALILINLATEEHKAHVRKGLKRLACSR